jgi:glycosyltransferase involved in cell wall biosynthesis
MTPRVTVITTVYDRVPCLTRCLRALQHSQYTDWEQIVVADAPPDGVVPAIMDAIRTLADPRVDLIVLPTRTNDWGITPAETGLAHARGQYVAFCSDDNAFMPDHLGPLVEALDADPALGFVYASCRYAGQQDLRDAFPRGGRIDLGQPLFRRTVLPATMPHREHAWDWRLIQTLMLADVRWQHVDQLSFVFRLDAYPDLVEALA